MEIKNVRLGEPFFKKNWIIELVLNEKPQDLSSYMDKSLDVTIKQHREKRSLNANAYFHVLVDKIAAVNHTSHTEVHNHLIAEYGQMDADIQTIILDDEIPWEKVESIHLRPTQHIKVLDNGRLYRVYIVMRGSHTYDTKEMSTLIDGTVSEAKELGIETLTPDELERMKAAWKV